MHVTKAVICVGFAISLQAFAQEPFGFEPPEFLRGPDISRAATGNTYSFRGTGLHPDAALQMTRVEIPAASPRRDANFCIQAFLAEIEQRAAGFFSQQNAAPLQAGIHEFASWRWSGALATRPSTGVVSCGIVGDSYIAITFQDATRRAPVSFPAIRARLSKLAFE